VAINIKFIYMMSRSDNKELFYQFQVNTNLQRISEADPTAYSVPYIFLIALLAAFATVI
jgi:hypothetical protein